MRIVIGTALLVAGIYLGAFLVGPTTTIPGAPMPEVPAADQPSVGDCVNIDQRQRPTTLLKAGCTDRYATYVVADYDNGTTQGCTEPYERYVDPRGRFSPCLIIKGYEGDCFDGFITAAPDHPKAKADCGGVDQVVVTQRIEQYDGTTCTFDAQWQLTYSSSELTICLKRA